jgi:hypothetical protein
VTAASDVVLHTGDPTDYRSHAQISNRLGALEAACKQALGGRAEAPYAGSPQNSLNAETLRVAVGEARELLALVAPSLLRSVVSRPEIGEGDRDAAPKQEEAVSLRAGEADPDQLWGLRHGFVSQVGQPLIGVESEVLPVVANLHDQSSSSVRSPAAGTADRSLRTVEAPTDSAGVPLRAGRSVGRRSRGWLLQRLRGRSSP